MKKLIFVALLFILPLPSFAGQVERVYKKLIRATGVKYIPIYVRSAEKGCELACTNGQRIVVTTTLLENIQNEDELAWVIGHEMAHAKHKSETKADVLGLQYAQKAGYRYCVAAQLLKLFREDETHPSGMVRYRNTGCP